MSIKQQIIERINGIDDPAILNEILNLISAETEMNSVYRLSAEQEKKIEQGLEDVDNGKTMTQEESDKMIQQWLDEQSSGQ